jgi:two-component system, cell cycle sensor histidine kinase and response regulator CckA
MLSYVFLGAMTPPPAEHSGTETLLIVENEPAIRNLLQMSLRKNGYTVLAAESAREALEIARGHLGAIDLLITDVVMPDMNGPELVKELAAIRPATRTLFMSGYMNDALGDQGVSPDHANFIQKPFSPRVIAQKVRDILDGTSSPA